MLERLEGYGDKVVKAHHLGEGDVLIITSVYGMNACTIDAALEAKRRGCKLIAITSTVAAERTPPGFPARHSSRQNLHELADVTIDTHVPHGEVCLDVAELRQSLGGTCNILQCFCINALVIETALVCKRRGFDPPLWVSANIDGGDERNRALLDKYTPRVKSL
ncbi:MAG TPA: sugar isomerase domain-containing protein, partial [Spirochaetia bacterium]|nr:sugar isomerase domain-containing protein [Spirochaetia bacterium]